MLGGSIVFEEAKAKIKKTRRMPGFLYRLTDEVLDYRMLIGYSMNRRHSFRSVP